jgi:aryl-alcohol dehydrogenase
MIPGHVVRGVPEGDSNPREFIPFLLEQYQAGSFPIDRLIDFYPFDRINEAIADSRSGKTIKPILTF